MTDGNTLIAGYRQMASVEKQLLAIDFTPDAATGETFSAPTATLYDLSTGLTYPAGLAGSPNVAGDKVQQTVQTLLPGHHYWLLLEAQGSAGNSWASILDITCVV